MGECGNSKTRDEKFDPFVDIMKISDEETELLTDEKEPERAAKVRAGERE